MSQKEIQALTSLLGKMKAGQPKKKKAQAGSSGSPGPTPGTMGTVVTQSAKRRKKPKGGAQAAYGGDGAITLSRRELLGTVKTASKAAKGVFPLVPSANSMAWLANLTKCFERIVWHSATIEWIPMVGTQTAGSIIFGVDWSYGLKATDVDRPKVASLTPLVDAPIWQRGSLNLNQGQLQTRRFYSLLETSSFDNSPGQLAYAATGDDGDVGELWITYRVSLSGTRPV